MPKFSPDQIDYLKTLSLPTLERLFAAHIEDLERAVLQSRVSNESDFSTLAVRAAELEGARKLSTSVLSYLTSLRKRNPPG
jgi:hypothetical protein